jgi:hypothetical protein
VRSLCRSQKPVIWGVHVLMSSKRRVTGPTILSSTMPPLLRSPPTRLHAYLASDSFILTTPLPGGYLYFLELVDFKCLYNAHVFVSLTLIVSSRPFLLLFTVMIFTSARSGFRMGEALSADFHRRSCLFGFDSDACVLGFSVFVYFGPSIECYLLLPTYINDSTPM